MLLVVAAASNFNLMSVDIKADFLQSDESDQEIDVKQPKYIYK